MEAADVAYYVKCLVPYVIFGLVVLFMPKGWLRLFHRRNKPPQRMCDHTGASIRNYPRAPKGKAGKGWRFPPPAAYVWVTKKKRWECPVCKDIYG